MKFANLPAAPRFLMLLAILFLTGAGNLFAQTSWTGTVSTAWNTAGNWSAGVPDATDDVTIPNVTNDPVISVAGAVAKSVTVQASGILTLSAAGTLVINGATADGFHNLGTVQNSGTISIGTTSGAAANGIQNEATFNNNSGGQIHIDRVTGSFSSLFNYYGTFTNAGTITSGAISGGGFSSLYNYQGNFNNAGGVINISNATTAINLVYGGITNSGTINIGPAGSATMGDGMVLSYGTFTNSAGAQININRVTTGITNYGVTLANAGTVTIGAETTVSNLFENYDAAADGPFNNNTGGTFKATGIVRSPVFVNAGGTLVPGNPIGKLTFNGSEDFTSSIMSLGVNGTGTAGVNYDQVEVIGTATLGGTLALSINFAGVAGDQVTILSAAAVLGTFSSVTGLPANWYVNYTPVSVILSYQPIPKNTWTGSVSTDWNNAGNWSAGLPDATDDVTIPNVANDPVISNNSAVAKSVRVQSGGILTTTAAGVLTINGGSIFGLWNQGTTINNGTIRVGNTSSTGNYGIYNETVFNNNSGSFLYADRASTTNLALKTGTVANTGTVNIGSVVPVSILMTAETGTFSNNTGGTIKGTGTIPAANFTNNGGTLSPGYSPGKMTFNAPETFTSNILAIEINGTGTAGTNFDQLVVSGTATLGGTLNVSIGYAPTLGDEFIIVSASAVTGTFSTITGLPAGWNVLYYPSTVVVIYGLPASTWTGTVSTAWNTAGNWSAGVPNAATEVTIPNTTNDPVISSSGIAVKSVTIQTGGLLTISASGVISINGAKTAAGLINQGTVQNNGTINIGTTSAVFQNGIENEGTFNNNNGAQIHIDRVPATGVLSSIFNDYGTFTNAGTITTGAISPGGKYGIYNFHGTFNNTGGVVNISNASGGIDLVYGDITNSGVINLGPAGSATMDDGLILSYGTFTNSAGAQININRSTTGITSYNVTLANAGTVTIGAETTVSNLFENVDGAATGPFSNNAGGIFKATGTIRAPVFVNAGGTLVPGYSPGKLTFNGSEDFTSCIMSMEVNGTGTPGTNYDQVMVIGTATLGGTLALSINYAGAQGNQVTLVSATSITGTFATVTGLLPNWKVSYTATTVLLTYDLTNTWTGTTNNSWNTATNWSSGIVPTAANNVIIPNVTNDPIISVAGAVARTIHVMLGGSLTLNVTGSLTTNGTLPFNGVNAAIYNQGTVTIKGPLMVKPN